jgi:O-antigen ligase
LAFAGLLLFIALVYAIPGNWFDGMEDIPFAKIAAGLSLAALAGSWLLYHRRLTLGGGQGWALLALFSLVGFSSLWSYWPKYTFDIFADGLKYFAVFLLVANVVDSPARLARTVSAIAFATVIPALGAIWSYYHGEHLVEGDRAAWIGSFGNPNDLAYYLVVGVALILAAREGARSPMLRWIYLVLLLPIGNAILLTQSRSGMTAACVIVMLWFLRTIRRAPLWAGAAIALACTFFVSPNNPWHQRTENATSHGEDMSARGRIDAWRTGINIARERPFSGVGAGAFMIAWPDFAPGDVGEARSEHNTFIQLISELGIPGLCLFLVALLTSILGLTGATSTGLTAYARGIQFGLAGFSVCSLWGGIAWTWPVYLLIGLSVAIRRLAGAASAPVGQPYPAEGLRAPLQLRGGG